jgi:hypothetical protein
LVAGRTGQATEPASSDDRRVAAENEENEKKEKKGVQAAPFAALWWLHEPPAEAIHAALLHKRRCLPVSVQKPIRRDEQEQ